DYDRLLTTILVGNNLVNIMATALATVLFTNLYKEYGATISTLVMTPLVLIFGEVTPKSVAKETPEKFAMSVCGIMKFLVFILTPINFVFTLWKKLISSVFHLENDDSMTQEELITIVEEAQKDGDLEEHESDLITAAIEFNDLEVNEILTPRVDVVALDIETTMDEMEEAFRTNSYSRFPIYEDTIDNVIGILHEKDFYYAYYNDATDVRGILKPIQYTSSHVKISELLRQLQSSKTHMAVVLDEYGGTAGIITMEDILEELVGEIYDEHDEVREYYHKVSENTYLVEGDCDLGEMFELFDMEETDDDYDVNTVSGWAIQNMKRIPREGDTFVADHLFVTVMDADEKLVKNLKVQLLDEEQDKEEE
ncbi:MAG: HlyC/CorC family transporter, partial [Erysipelotrichaceae bacterium]|nr:HlyC/CorC family transporter [Erysipelotrichaceae bacterium]